MTDREIVDFVKHTLAMNAAICTTFADNNPYEEMRARPDRVLTDEERAERIKRIREDPIRKRRANKYISISHGNIKSTIEGEETNDQFSILHGKSAITEKETTEEGEETNE